MSDDNVTPFRRRGPKPLPPEEAALSPRVRRATPDARKLAAEQAAARRERYGAALAQQKSDRLIATGKVVPARITMALDLRGLEGPEVDTACGATEPDVDMGELGRPHTRPGGEARRPDRLHPVVVLPADKTGPADRNGLHVRPQ